MSDVIVQKFEAWKIAWWAEHSEASCQSMQSKYKVKLHGINNPFQMIIVNNLHHKIEGNFTFGLALR